MTFQSAFVLSGIVSVFLIFGTSLAWVDFYTHRRQKPVNEERRKIQEKAPEKISIEERRAA